MCMVRVIDGLKIVAVAIYLNSSNHYITLKIRVFYIEEYDEKDFLTYLRMSIFHGYCRLIYILYNSRN